MLPNKSVQLRFLLKQRRLPIYHRKYPKAPHRSISHAILVQLVIDDGIWIIYPTVPHEPPHTS